MRADRSRRASARRAILFAGLVVAAGFAGCASDGKDPNLGKPVSVPRLKAEWSIDFIIVNGENSAAGRGITPKISIDLLRAGVAVITSGDHIWDQKEIVPFLNTEPRLLRPLNYPPETPGNGSIVLETPKLRAIKAREEKSA